MGALGCQPYRLIDEEFTLTEIRRMRRGALSVALACVLVLTGVASAQSAAPPHDPGIGKWFDDASIGWFPHWGLGSGRPEDRVEGSGYVYRNAEEFERAAEAAGWSAATMVNVAKRMRASYISIATLHSRLGYLKIWPSDVPGSLETKRDFLGELIAEADRHGIKVVVYITGDPLWWNDNRDNQSAPPPAWLPYGDGGWLDYRAYQAHKGDPSIDIRRRVDWKRHYAKDVIDEIITRYPKVGGFWFDGWGGGADSAEGRAAIEVFQHIHTRLPGAVNIKNNGSGVRVPGEDVAAMEDCASCLHRKEPDYDVPSQFPRGPYQYENAFETLGWWYRHSDTQPWPARQNAFHLKKPITSIANSWTPGWGIGNDMSGGLPPTAEALVAQLDRYMSWASESLVGVRGGGYAEGGFDPGYWNDGAYGVTTMKPGSTTHYLHVLTPPSGNRLVVPDAGYDVTAVKDLQTGQPLHFTQTDGRLTVDVPSWDAALNQAATVLKVTTTKQDRVLPTNGWTATGPTADGTNVPAKALDGDYTTLFRATSGHAAFGKPATQSSLSSGGVPSRAVDGNTNGAWSSGTITHTSPEHQPWWQVDLEQVRDIDQITVWGRTDACCASRLSDYYVLVSNEPFGAGSLDEIRARPGVWSRHEAGTPSPSTKIDVGRAGRYVRVQLAGTNALSLAEVEVGAGRQDNALVVDTQASRKIAGLRVVQPESSRIAVLNEGERIQSTRIRDYELAVSNDGQQWTPVSIGQLANQRGRQTVTFDPVDARYFRLGVKSTHNDANNRIEIVDLQAIRPGVSIPTIREKVDGHLAANELDEALAVTLRAHLDQAERQYDGRTPAAAARVLERFVWQLNKPSARHRITEYARADLQRDAEDLINRWQA